MVKSFSQDLSTNFAVRTTIKPAEHHSLLFARQYNLPYADSQIPPLIHSLTADSQLTKFRSSKHARLNTADTQLEQVEAVNQRLKMCINGGSCELVDGKLYCPVDSKL